jgi:zinc transport system substrate-binding protein
MKSKRVYVIFLSSLMILAAVLSFTACSANEVTSPENSAGVETDQPLLIATLFPQYDFVRQIAGDLVRVQLLLPPGVESHAYDPTPRDIASINEADAFLYTGEAMEPWASKIIQNLSGKSVKVVDLSRGIELIEGHHEEHSEDEPEDESDDHEEGEFDPHIWLDPNNAKIMVQTLLETLIEIDPVNEAVYRDNAQAYLSELTDLDMAFRVLFERAETKSIFYGGHFAFGYFAKAYGLETVSPYDGFSPNAEPTPKRIAALIDALKEAPFKYIYFEELVDPKIATIVSQETGAEMLLLHGAHNLSRQELDQGITYLDIMRENLERLKLGMGYRE